MTISPQEMRRVCVTLYASTTKLSLMRINISKACNAKVIKLKGAVLVPEI